MITVLWPCTGFVISSTWQEHLNRPGYNRAYAGTDLARSPCPLRGSQYGGRVLQSMMSTQGYGYTTLVEYSGDDGPVLRVRNAHQKDLGVKVGDLVTPATNLGILDSTGNSTGHHTHFEVWLNIGGVWINIDPLDPRYQVQLVNDPAQLIPLGGAPVPDPVYTPPAIPVLSQVRCTAVISKFINLRETPYISGRIIGQVVPGETWGVIDIKQDNYTNVWLRLVSPTRCGWAAAYYNGEIWLEVVT